MKFKGTIIITDPCYIIKECPEYPVPEDFNLPWSVRNKPLKDLSTPEELAYSKACDEYWKECNKYNDWEKCDYGEDMEVLGITQYISKPTIYGDWSCTTWSTPRIDVKNQVEELNKLYSKLYKTEEGSEENKFYEDEIVKETSTLKDIGRFCADTGMVAVFLLDEVLEYNPDFEEWIKEHSWCVTTIPDFDGDVQYYIDDNDDAHIVGVGNINFFTTQTGL